MCVSLVCSESEESCAVIAGLGMKIKAEVMYYISPPLGHISKNQSDIYLYLYAFIYLYMYNIPSVSQTFTIFFCANIDILTDNRKPKE